VSSRVFWFWEEEREGKGGTWVFFVCLLVRARYHSSRGIEGFGARVK
jgi:hypothetical protein